VFSRFAWNCILRLRFLFILAHTIQVSNGAVRYQIYLASDDRTPIEVSQLTEAVEPEAAGTRSPTKIDPMQLFVNSEYSVFDLYDDE
jgi:hypothetical protein